jgi:hypothetical protein
MSPMSRRDFINRFRDIGVPSADIGADVARHRLGRYRPVSRFSILLSFIAHQAENRLARPAKFVNFSDIGADVAGRCRPMSGDVGADVANLRGADVANLRGADVGRCRA